MGVKMMMMMIPIEKSCSVDNRGATASDILMYLRHARVVQGSRTVRRSIRSI